MITRASPHYPQAVIRVLTHFPTISAKGLTEKHFRRFDVQIPPDTNDIFIPIYDEFGSYQGVKVRVHSGNPKYLSYPPFIDSPLFNYRSIIGRQHIILTEGVFEAILLDTVSSLGTSLSSEGAEILKASHFTHCLIHFDNDTAGFKSSMRIAKMLYQNGVNCLVAPAPPLDLYHNKDDFMKMLAETQGLKICSY